MKTHALRSLLAFAIFIFTFLGAGIFLGDFYALPAPVAAVAGIVAAFVLIPGKTDEKITTFLAGCGDRNILTMCIIYLLAGAFAVVSKAIGSTDAIVQIGTGYLSPKYYAAGIFVVASFLSIASGTSVGTIVALGPIAIGLAQASGTDVNLIAAALLGGAMFGDNLSIISDTTIAATQMLGCKMRDKFRNNLSFVLPAAIIALALYLFVGVGESAGGSTSAEINLSHIVLILPYLLVILLAFFGVNVFVTLSIGVAMSGVFGLINQSFDLLGFGQKIYEGFTSMTEIFLLSLLTGGLAALVERAGGLKTLLHLVKKGVRGPKTALLGIGAFVGLTDAATANNTISILITGKLAKKLTDEYRIRPKVTASVLDTFSCVVQGLIPYGAQILILTGFSNGSINYLNLLSYNFYIYLLAIAVILYILFRHVTVAPIASRIHM